MGRHRVIVAEPAVEADGYLLLASGDDDKSISAFVGGGGIYAVEHAVQADAPESRNVALIQADVDDLEAAGVDGDVLDEAQTRRDQFQSPAAVKPAVDSAVAGQGGPAPVGQQVAGSKLIALGDVVRVFLFLPSLADSAEDLVPNGFVHAQGGADVMAGAFGLGAVVQSHIVGFSLEGVHSAGLEGVARLEAAGQQPGPSQRPHLRHQFPVGCQQGHLDVGALHLTLNQYQGGIYVCRRCRLA